MSLASLWIGDRLGPIELTSLKSFLAHGNSVSLYVYEPVKNIPAGVTVLDANEILPQRGIVRHHKTGSPALHSDMFRFALLKKTAQTWVDLDFIAFGKIDTQQQWIFAPEAPGYFNGAVLRLPEHSKALQDLSRFNADTRGVPPHLVGLRRFKAIVKNILYGGWPIRRWPWGSIGPAGLTYFLTKHEEAGHALPLDAFYHIPLKDVARFVEPGGLAQSEFPLTAWGVHLWGKELRAVIARHYGGVIPRDCYLGALMQTYGVDDEIGH